MPNENELAQASVAGRLIGAARWLVLVSSRWVAGQGIRPRTFAALALVAGALMSLCLPPPELIFREGSFRIEALGTRLKLVNIGLMPLLITLFALGFAFLKRRRRAA